ncbi:MAG: MBL fold metallo-hydrolase [Oscillospiraceae bacterium]|nr:MBL fold metallo-hydrolase [Oscillospiraceae bacterium]
MRLCTFASGSKGNCSLISIGNKNFLVDAGISMKRICTHLSACSLAPADLDGIFITHQHSDHISGLAMFSKHYAVPVYAPRSTAAYLRMSLSCKDELINILPIGAEIDFGDVKVSSFATSHDTEESVGYRFCGERIFAIATDTGAITENIINGLVGADVVVIESNHDVEMLKYGPYPYPLKQRILSSRGHLSNVECGKLACYLADNGTEYIVLAHLSRDNNTPKKAFDTVCSCLDGRKVNLFVAPEAEPLTIELGGGLK